MLLPVTAGGASHVTLKYLPVICGGGESCHDGNLRNALPLPQKRKAILHPQEQDIVKDCHFHIFLKKTAALTLTDIHMVCNFVQCKLLCVIFLDKG